MKLHRAVAVAAALAIPLTVTAACGDSNSLGSGTGGKDEAYQLKAADTLPASVQKLKDKGQIVVGTKFDQPGFGLQNPGSSQIEGFDAEIGRLLSIRIFGSADKVKFVETKSAIREQAIQNATVDVVIATYTINDKRKEVVDFAGPYFQAGQDILVKKGNDAIKSVDDLKGKKVCTQENSTSLKNLQDKGIEPQTRSSYALCAEGVKDGSFDALSTDNVILLGLASKSPDDVKVLNAPFTQEPYGIGLKKGDTELRAFINDTLDAIKSNGDWRRAWDKTAGKFLPDPPVDNPPNLNRY
jgi:glutamate transport system substrate-binding protein